MKSNIMKEYSFSFIKLSLFNQFFIISAVTLRSTSSTSSMKSQYSYVINMFVGKEIWKFHESKKAWQLNWLIIGEVYRLIVTPNVD